MEKESLPILVRGQAREDVRRWDRHFGAYYKMRCDLGCNPWFMSSSLKCTAASASLPFSPSMSSRSGHDA